MRRLGVTAVAVLVVGGCVVPAGAARAGSAGERSRTLTVGVSGDLLVHAPVWQRARAHAGGRGYDFRPLFRRIRPVLRAADLSVCHVETPLVPGPPRGYPSFRTPPALAPALRASGWRVCTTASNHTLDAGRRGVATTLQALRRAGVVASGSAATAAGARRTPMVRVRGVDVAVLGFTEMTNGVALPRPWSVKLADARRILRDARLARRRGADAVIVAVHWGEEFRAAPSAFQRRLADRLTRSEDVTAVVGHHAHVPQPVRWLRGTPVVFGLGNLLSNQSAACCPAASQDGLIGLLRLRVSGGDGDGRGLRVRATRVDYLPTVVRRPSYLVAPASGASRRRTIRTVGRSARVRPLTLRGALRRR